MFSLIFGDQAFWTHGSVSEAVLKRWFEVFSGRRALKPPAVSGVVFFNHFRDGMNWFLVIKSLFLTSDAPCLRHDHLNEML